MDAPERIDVDGVSIAVRRRTGREPGLVWLGGYRSDMMGTKAQTLDEWSAANNRAFVRHDYSGHGESGGDFRDGTISRWLNESLDVLDRFGPGRQVLVGSSMGAWIALRMVQELRLRGERDRIAGMILLAPAPDFTAELIEPKLKRAQRRALAEKGFFEEKSAYSDQPDIYTRALLEDGAANRVLDGIVETGCPVHILQGTADPDVPHTHAERLMQHLPVCDVTLSLIRDGDHRLSRPQDLALLLRTVEGMLTQVERG